MTTNDMCSIHLKLSTLYHIFLTQPITCAVVEWSFNWLKLIKSYLHSRMGEDKLSGLALFDIERYLATNIDYDKVIDDFAWTKVTNVCIYPTHPLQVQCVIKSNFIWNTHGLNSELSVSQTGCQTKAREHSLPYNLFITKRGNGFKVFPRALVQSKTQTAFSRIF